MTTLNYMQTRQPSIQCFFLDACSEINLNLIQNPQEAPGKPLCEPTNAAQIATRDASIYFGSYAGLKAYGPEDGAPFFTQELMQCLEKRAADSSTGFEQVTTNSLRTAMAGAGARRAELENRPISFSYTAPGQSNWSAPLCQVRKPLEVLVKVQCSPKDAMSSARLYAEFSGTRVARSAPRSDEWYTAVTEGDCVAGAEFDDVATLASTKINFRPVPPLYPVQLKPVPKS